jgi:hydrogenase maturation protease
VRPIRIASHEFWIIGYGNAHRRDDGIGPYVVNRLYPYLGGIPWVRMKSVSMLDPLLVLQMDKAKSILFIDASATYLKTGSYWVEVIPEMYCSTCLSHHIPPSFFLGILHAFLRRCPPAWLITIQGDDFGLGGGLTPDTEKRVEAALSDIVQFISEKAVDKDTQQNDYEKKE